MWRDTGVVGALCRLVESLSVAYWTTHRKAAASTGLTPLHRNVATHLARMYFLRLLNFKANKHRRHPHQPLVPITPLNTTGTRPRKTSWAGLTTFLDLLNRSVGAAGPLKSAVGELVECIGICDVRPSPLIPT
ncbi:hypothetical protein RSAG8_03496, partial [Rhizoctonia solani AG-8 WAC10335]